MKNWQQLLLRVVAILLLVAGFVFMLPILGYIANGLLKVIVKNELVAFIMGMVFAGFGLLVILGILGVSKQQYMEEQEEFIFEEEEEEKPPKKKIQKLEIPKDLRKSSSKEEQSVEDEQSDMTTYNPAEYENAGGWNMN